MHRRLEEHRESIYDLKFCYANYMTDIKGVKKVFRFKDEDNNAKVLKAGLDIWKMLIEHTNVRNITIC